MRYIHLLSCGGTIEKIYSEQTGSVLNIEDKIVRYLDRLRLPDTEVETTRLMNKDSLEMNDEDRRMVLDAVRARLRERAAPIVITHGTDTMVDTGLYLKQGLPDLTAPIVLTGAMTPLGFENSDGLQNLTESLFATQLLPAGVWVVMHGHAFPIDKVRKDRTLARFVATDQVIAAI
jgi:L-asparaginase